MASDASPGTLPAPGAGLKHKGAWGVSRWAELRPETIHYSRSHDSLNCDFPLRRRNAAHPLRRVDEPAALLARIALPCGGQLLRHGQAADRRELVGEDLDRLAAQRLVDAAGEEGDHVSF